MSYRNPNDPYGGRNPLVDQVIGPTAYEIVRFVAIQMPVIQKVANQPFIRLGSTGVTSGAVTQLLFPPNVSLETLVDSTVWVIDPLTGDRYNADSGYFTLSYKSAGVVISFKSEAPAQLLTGAKVDWYVTAVEIR